MDPVIFIVMAVFKFVLHKMTIFSPFVSLFIWVINWWIYTRGGGGHHH